MKQYEFVIQYFQNGKIYNAYVYGAYANNNTEKAVLNACGPHGFRPSEVTVVFKYTRKK